MGKEIDMKENRSYNVFTGNLRFEWDTLKNDINIQKHGVSFPEAITVFDDDNALLISDINHSLDEERFIIIGLSKMPRVLYVCHCYREQSDAIRIISARVATKTEENYYERQGFQE